jgi:hypothetical protein
VAANICPTHHNKAAAVEAAALCTGTLTKMKKGPMWDVLLAGHALVRPKPLLE